MSWLFSRVLVAAFSAGNCSAGTPFAQWSGTPTPQAFCAPDKMTDFSRPSRFGMTFGHLTDDHGAALLRWCLAASHARTSASPAMAMVSTASDPACGPKWRGSLARYDHDSRSWKTAQHSLLADSDEFSETWPRWGTTVDGELYLLPTLVRHTSASASGSWPTPCARDYRGVFRTERGLARRLESKRGIPLNEAAGGLLNPPWVEWLMGWPPGWTELQPSATDKYRSALRTHGNCLQEIEA